ncbi:hypothetical protein MFLO_05849 [Listeria floridensis FSL S10-1187]|uniref:Uncharacterized protein n=1 Tax=Listeria floridensis FSL S10-1187 TaxID=1265817 RepID=A0ABP3B198_9LIST|nr:hypothetical protein MFLO_05849 [Listeria floridensis FSL S10-1187]
MLSHVKKNRRPALKAYEEVMIQVLYCCKQGGTAKIRPCEQQGRAFFYFFGGGEKQNENTIKQ